MATGDFSIKRTSTAPRVVRWQTDAGDTAILAGEPVKIKAAGSPYVIPLADGDLTIGTDTAMVGIAKGNSTHTASADGVVDVYAIDPNTVYTAKATTAGNLADTLVGDRVTVDLAGGTYTIDEDATDNAANAFYIVGVDADAGTVDFTIRTDATITGA